MRFFVWNDSPQKLKEWSELIKSRSLGMTHEVHATHELNIPEVLAEFSAFDPDVVLLDIVASNVSRSHGLDIAREIRQFDSLVPIIAVTEDPSAVYEASGDLASLAFAGIHHASVMNKASFWSSALRPSLNNWHLIAPDYALIRQLVGQLNVQTREEGVRPSFEKLAALLKSLPLLGDTDVWHKTVSKEIGWLMEPVFPHLAKRFRELCALFQKSDPFYMASTSSRKHLSHNVQVFLLGLLVLTQHPEIRENAIRHLKSSAVEEAHEDEVLFQAILVWACVGLTHDTAYLSEAFPEVFDTLAELGAKFRVAFNTDVDIDLSGLKGIRWPKMDRKLGRNTHPGVGRELWISTEGSSSERELASAVGSAVARHDSKVARDLTPVLPGKWLDFLAVLCDELQDWGRSRTEELKRWRLFVLEHIRLVGNEDGWVLNLLFVALDHPSAISEIQGTTPSHAIEESFRYTTKNIRDNLRCTGNFKIVLRATFPSRPKLPDIREAVTLQQAELSQFVKSA